MGNTGFTVTGDFIGYAVLSTVLVKTIGEERFALGIVCNGSVDADTVSASTGMNDNSSPVDTDFIDDEGSVIAEHLTSVELIVAVVTEDVVVSADCMSSDVDVKEPVVVEAVGESVVEVVLENLVYVTSFLSTVVFAEEGYSGDGYCVPEDGVVGETPSHVRQQVTEEYSTPFCKQSSIVQDEILSPYSQPIKKESKIFNPYVTN